MTNEFLDTEFFEDGKTIDLISIALVSDSGRELYACNLDVDMRRIHASPHGEWFRQNLLPSLPPVNDPVWMHHGEIREAVASFVLRDYLDTHIEPEFWAWYGATDWVACYQLFGRLLDLPEHWPRRFRELKELTGKMHLPKRPEGHSALLDARWARDCHKLATASKLY